MKTKLTITLLLFFVSLHLLAQQNPFIGTWKLVKAVYQDENGKNITRDATAVKQYKIITPTHFM
jgi:hypothetical protein